MGKSLLHRVPERVRALLGNDSTVCLLNGRDVFLALKDEPLIVMACNPRIKHVIPGIMKAAEELDAVIAFELTRTEGGARRRLHGADPGTLLQYHY